MSTKKERGRLIIISAPSGGGKTSVIHFLTSKFPDLIHSISHTTRPKRPGKVDEGYYHFVDMESFREGIRKDLYAEWAEVHDNLYGTPKEPLERALNEKKDILLDVDIVGGMKLKALYGDRAVSIFLVPPSIEALDERLSERKTDSGEVCMLRLKNALEELKYKDRYDHQVVNDDLDRACLEVEELLFGPLGG